MAVPGTGQAGIETVPEAPSVRAGRPPRRLNLALQGGGAHGAFTWGVIDRLLEEEWLEIEGISGTSAGAINAAVMAHGYRLDGRAGGRAALERFWHAVSRLDALSPALRPPFAAWMGQWNLDASPAMALFDLMTRSFSPYQLNPLNLHPLREILAAQVDCASLEGGPIKLFVSATNVEQGKVRVFEKHDVTIDALIASACLPNLFQAVEIEGEHYWDGGYMGNPAIFPLVYGCDSADVALVMINPIHRPGVPRTPAEIMNRLNEISFNSTLMREMRAIAFVTKLVEDENLDTRRYKRMNMHLIGSDETMLELGVASKMNVDWTFLTYLKDKGRATASEWLERHGDGIGDRSTADIRGVFL